MTENLTMDQIAEFKEAFLIFDKDGDGSISVKEIGTVMRSLGQNPSDDELKNIVDEIDQDGSGTIDFKEFLNMMAKKIQELSMEDDLIEAFRYFDMDGKGLISTIELKHVLSNSGEKLSEDEIDDIIREVDTDCDGYIDYKEFVRILIAQ